jgi:hypothetical protein
MNRRGWIVLGGLVLLVTLFVLLRGPAGSGDSPEHRSDRDGANGTSALRLYAADLGHPTGIIEGDFALPSGPALLFVFSPLDTNGFSYDEVQKLNNWLAAGGVLVYADERSEPQLDTQFGLHRARAQSYGNGTQARNASTPAPIFGGVGRVSGGDPADKLIPSPGQVPVLRNDGNEVIALRTAVGQGQIIALTDPLILCNGYLGKADNGRLAADLIALAPAGSAVLFDEFHHGAAGAASAGTAWMSTPWGAALLWAVIVLFAGFALRGRAFGPALSLQPARDRSSAEYASAVGGLLHRTGARAITLETLLKASRRAVAERMGLGGAASGERFAQVLDRRAPAISQELARIEAHAAASSDSEAGMLEAARRLHALAYPLPSSVNGKESG